MHGQLSCLQTTTAFDLCQIFSPPSDPFKTLKIDLHLSSPVFGWLMMLVWVNMIVAFCWVLVLSPISGAAFSLSVVQALFLTLSILLGLHHLSLSGPVALSLACKSVSTCLRCLRGGIPAPGVALALIMISAVIEVFFD